MPFAVDPLLMESWLRARSISRGLPQPVSDSGGLRVDSGLPHETRRYLFARPVEGLRELAERIHEPHVSLKLCDTPETLRGYLPLRWEIFPPNFVMICDHLFEQHIGTKHMPEGYRLDLETRAGITQARVFSACNEIAASGYATRHHEVFIYDRILTSEHHRRKGLATLIMIALAFSRPASISKQILVATPEGRALYRSLGWTDYAPYTTAIIPQ